MGKHDLSLSCLTVFDLLSLIVNSFSSSDECAAGYAMCSAQARRGARHIGFYAKDVTHA